MCVSSLTASVKEGELAGTSSRNIMELVFLAHLGCGLVFPDRGERRLAEVYV